MRSYIAWTVDTDTSSGFSYVIRLGWHSFCAVSHISSRGQFVFLGVYRLQSGGCMHCAALQGLLQVMPPYESPTSRPNFLIPSCEPPSQVSSWRVQVHRSLMSQPKGSYKIRRLLAGRTRSLQEAYLCAFLVPLKNATTSHVSKQFLIFCKLRSESDHLKFPALKRHDMHGSISLGTTSNYLQDTFISVKSRA